jgi:hypothetical protein
MRYGRGEFIRRVIKAIKFIETNKTWTIKQFSNHIGIDDINGAKWMTELSIYYPIYEIEPPKYGVRHGLTAAIYGLMEK